MSLSVLIVDDEQPARERLQRLLADFDDVATIAQQANGREAVAACQKQHFDIVLLDIRMPGMDGIETAAHLQALPHTPAIIFTTAYDQYAIDAFETEAIGYLLKPVRRERLRGAIDKAQRLTVRQLVSVRQKTDSAKRFIATRRGEELALIPVEDIAFFEADQKYVHAWHRKGDDLIDDSLKSLESELGGLFVRVHRKLLVALSYIEALEKNSAGIRELRLRHTDRRLPVSRRHLSELKARLGNS